MKGWKAPHPDGMEADPVGFGTEASCQDMGDRSQERLRSGLGTRFNAEERAAALEDRSLPGHGATEGQRAWGVVRRLACIGRAENPLAVIARLLAERGASAQRSGCEEKSSRRRRSFRRGGNAPPVGCCRAWPRQSLPLVQQASPDPVFVAWVGNLWPTFAAQGTRVRQAGTAPLLPWTEGSSDDSRQRRRPGNRQETSRSNGRNTDFNGMAAERHRVRNETFSFPVACIGQRNAHTVQKETRGWEFPRGAGRFWPRRSVNPGAGRGVHLASGCLGRSAPLAESPALARRDSAGSVPLARRRSGLHDQNAPFLPLRWRVAAPPYRAGPALRAA